MPKPLLHNRRLAMTIEQDVQDLKARVAAVERRLSGDRIDLRAGGTSLSIHSGGIEIESASRVTITAGQSVQITAGTALAVSAGSQCAISVGARFDINVAAQYAVSARGGAQSESGNEL